MPLSPSRAKPLIPAPAPSFARLGQPWSRCTSSNSRSLVLRATLSRFSGRRGGVWIGYRLTDRGRELAQSDDDLRRAVGELIGGPRSEVSEAIASLYKECEAATIDPRYRDDFLKTLEEIGVCFDAACYIASIALSGKILEVCLKEILDRHDALANPTPALASSLAPSGLTCPMSSRSIARECRQYRQREPHHSRAFEREVPIPSRDQTIMVLFAMRDVVRRNLSHQTP